MICVCLLILFITGIYLALTFYYKQGFMMNTWVNGVYCTGKTPEEVNRKLLQEVRAPYFTIVDKEDNFYEIPPEKISWTFDYAEALEELFVQQQSKPWYTYLNKEEQVEIKPLIRLNTEELFEIIDELAFVQKEKELPRELKIVMTEKGYELQDTLKNRLDTAAVYAYLEECLSEQDFLLEGLEKGMLFIDLGKEGFYSDAAPDAAQAKVLKDWQILKEYVYCGLVYDMGDQQIPLAGVHASSFIAVDEEGNICFDQEGQPLINEKAIEDFINSLAEAYNTYKTELTFTSTAGEEKTIPYVNYGTEIHIHKEIAYLTEAFREKRSEVHIPIYKRQGYVRGKDDIGDTYIEVDMGNQKMYAYLDGELLAETDIVTGNMKKKMATPEGVVYIYAKQRNRTLRGPGYASFVKYWMPVKGGIGLHDANWRRNFGAEIYKTDGSHGCINIPRNIMKEIYDHFEVGTPVIMFY